jgi:Tol biopolymer transport system component
MINLVNTDGTNYRELYSSSTGASFRNLAWSPDGSRLVYVLEDYLYYRSTLHEINIATGIQQDLVVGMEAIGYAAWSPDGAYLAFTHSSPEFRSDIFLLPQNGNGMPMNVTNRPSDEYYFVWKPR